MLSNASNTSILTQNTELKNVYRSSSCVWSAAADHNTEQEDPIRFSVMMCQQRHDGAVMLTNHLHTPPTTFQQG